MPNHLTELTGRDLLQERHNTMARVFWSASDYANYNSGEPDGIDADRVQAIIAHARTLEAIQAEIANRFNH